MSEFQQQSEVPEWMDMWSPDVVDKLFEVLVTRFFHMRVVQEWGPMAECSRAELG